MNLDEAFFAVMQLYTDLDRLVRQARSKRSRELP